MASPSAWTPYSIVAGFMEGVFKEQVFQAIKAEIMQQFFNAFY